MKYPTSETTKQELSAALKTLMSQKPLEKISIREISVACGGKPSITILPISMTW